MSLFPLIDAPREGDGTVRSGLPLYREVAWDFAANRPVWRGGRPVIVTGARAVQVWAWNTLHTVRGAHDVFSHDLGQDVGALIGRAYNEAVRQDEAIRYVREALLINPYITGVEQVRVDLTGSRLAIHAVLQTIYGEVEIHADDL